MANTPSGYIRTGLHIVRAFNIAANSSTYPASIISISVVIHLYTAWHLLDAETKAHVARFLRDVCEIKSFAIVRLGRKRPLAVNDMRNPDMEDDFCKKCKYIRDDSKQSATITGIVLTEWRLLAYALTVDTLAKIAEHARRLLFVAILNAISLYRAKSSTFEIGLLTIKFYAWEDVFQNVQTSDDREEYVPPIAWRVLRLGLDLLGCATAEVSAAFAITLHISSVGKIDYSDIALLVGSIGSLTTFTVTVAGLSEVVERFRKCTQYLQSFLDTGSADYVERLSAPSDLAVDFDDCSFSWGADKYSLAPITLQVKAGAFAVVVGRVGSGKSSFLSAICSEMPLVGGKGCVNGRIGYVEQKPWIMNATFRENVLMGADYDEAWFTQVVDACALAVDVRLFPDGDMTMIGRNGVNLSGGQKARLALAR
ncbi:hypothetical protein EV174_001292 [Coemansia sp. RSA 2320]|nr:hypothetical protein EV174_001292 [Coemansia sp. RSA 2320]